MAQYFMNIYSIPYFLACLLSFSLAGLLIAKKWKDSHVKLFIITQILLGTFTFAAGMATNSNDPKTWYFWASIIPMISTMGVTVYLHFSYVSYKNKGIFENKKMLLIYLVPLFFIAFYIINPEHIVIESNDSDLGLYDVQSIGLYSFFKPVVHFTLSFPLLSPW
jgi:hypothetical protein